MDFQRFNSDTASNTTKAMIDRAARIAMASQMRHKHGVVVTLGGSVVSVGVNVRQNPPLSYIPYDYLSTHAEINALSGINKHSSLVVYSARVNARTGNYLNAKPCAKCEEFMYKWTNVKRVIYT